MSIPQHHEIRIPALQLLSKHQSLKLREFEMPLARYFNLSAEELVQEYPTGNARIFYDRISWALSYMNMAGLLNKPERGVYLISALGLEQLQTPERINRFIKSAVGKRQKNRPIKPAALTTNESEFTPQEELYASAEKIRESRRQEILDTILGKTPREFEKLVVALLQKMGYGGEIKQSAAITPASNDGGIDGIIKEDVLGLGRIHIQAKCYDISNSVGREAVQKFVGALAVAQSNKGVFITTSSFTRKAEAYAENLNGSPTLILIDGLQLAEYLYEYGVGMQVEQTITIKKLDSEFWDIMENNSAK